MDEHGNEAISAVVDDGFLAGDDDDDDYEDLYNDVNVGENFMQSLNKSSDVADRSRESEHQTEPPPPPLASAEESKLERNGVLGGDDSKVSDIVEEVQKVEDKRNDVAPLPHSGGAMRINSGQVEQPPALNTNSNPSNEVVTVGSVVSVGNGGGHARPGANTNGSVYGGGGGSTMLFVGDLHWWTTDAELEGELCKYGAVKDVRFFDEKASGKSKGYAQVEFFDPAAATACKENMNGFIFNGRPCVVAFASPFSIKRMGEAQMNRATQQGAGQAGGGGTSGPVRRGPGEGPVGNSSNKPMGSNVASGGSYQGGGDNNRSYQGGGDNNRSYQGGGDNNRGYGRGNWGRGNGQGMGGRGPTGPIRNRPGGMMGRGMMGNGFGAGPSMLPPQAMMGQGFDPTFGAPMGRMGGYGVFPGGPAPPFSGMMSSFPPVGGVGLPGVAHVNPAFFGRGMGMNGMGMMSSAGIEGNNMGMWPDPNMAGWGGEEHGGRVAESSYVEEEVSDHQYKEVSRDRAAGGPNVMKEKDRRSEREWSGSSDKRYRGDREPEYERETPREKEVSHDQEWQERRHRDDRDVSREGGRDREQTRERTRDHDRGRDRNRDERERYVDHHRYKDREPEYDDEWEKGRSSRIHNKSRLSQEAQHFRSRDIDYSKRRRLTPE